eukprot:198248-Prymnesium_polylepis.1
MLRVRALAALSLAPCVYTFGLSNGVSAARVTRRSAHTMAVAAGGQFKLVQEGDKSLPPIFGMPHVLGPGTVITGLIGCVPNPLFQCDELIHHTSNPDDAKCNDIEVWAKKWCAQIAEKAKEVGSPDGKFHLICTSMGGCARSARPPGPFAWQRTNAQPI